MVRGVQFNEQEYLEMNPDVRSAVERGLFASGRAHFQEFGAIEGRAGRARAALADTAAPGARRNFFGTAPDYQNAFDLFAGEWSTRLPDACGWTASTGAARHCEDYRITWAANALGSFAGKTILELGPLEGGQSCMLEQMGARSIQAIEANPQAFLRCLVLKEAFGLTRTRFQLGDFTLYLNSATDHFDTIVACGVLYHLTKPVEVIHNIAGHCTEAFIWTHYYDEAFFAENSTAGSPFDPPSRDSYQGFNYTRHERRYMRALDWKGFCGGSAAAGCWLTKADLLSAFEYFGFAVVSILDEQNPNGPAMLVALRRKADGNFLRTG